jgi:branched-chain amino acid transport system substrate-binding protein
MLMRLIRRASLGAAVVGVLLTAGLACGPAIAQNQSFRFGLAMPLTGSQALYGQDQVKAAQWAVDDINKKGGVNGKKLEMIVLDTQGDPQLGIQAVNRLVSVEKVPAFVTAWSTVVKAVAPIANDNKVVELSIGAASPDIATLGDYVYTTFPLSDVDLTALAKYAYGTLGKRKLAVLIINNETGIASGQIMRDAFKKAGGEVVANEAYDQKATDFTGPLLKIRAASPDMIHLHGLVSDSPQVIAQARQLGLTQQITSYSVVYNPKLIEQAGAAAEGLIATSLAPDAADRPAVKDYLDRWQAEMKRPPNGLPYTQYLHDAPYFVAKVFESMDKKGTPITGENFRKEMLAIRSFDLPLTGKIDLTDDHRVVKPINLVEVKGGKWGKRGEVSP